MKMRILFFFPALLSLILSACDDAPVQESSSDYFPLKDLSTWKYVVEHMCYCPDSTYNVSYYYDVNVLGDTLLDGKVYQKLGTSNGNLRFVRKEGNQYWEWDSNSQEYRFLDTDVPLKGSWIRYLYGGVHTVEYSVHARNARVRVNGRMYNNVFVVREVFTLEVNTPYASSFHTYHYYARGFGKIMIRSPYDQPYQAKYKISLIP
jgi:hypothetical protein